MAGRSSAKDLLVLIIDVGPMMDIALPMGGETPLESSLRIATQIVTQKLFSGKSEVGIVLFGTPETDNGLATEDGGYDNISVVQQLVPPAIDMLKLIKGQIEMKGENQADFIDALVVGMDLMVKASEEIVKVGDKKIYLFTSCGSHYSDDGLDMILSGLKQHNIQLIVIGPNLQDDDGSDNNDSDGGAPRRPPPPSHLKGDSSKLKKTGQQMAGEEVLTRVVSAVDGISFTYPEALNIANVILKTSKKQTTRFAGEITIGSSLKIPCKVFTKSMLEKPATWKKLSAISQSSAHPGTMAVKYDRSYHLQDEDETEVETDDAVKGYRYGKSLVPVSNEDEDAMKLTPEKCLSVLGFTVMQNIKPHQIIGSSVQVVVPHPDDESAMTALTSLIHALYEMNMVAIVRYVFRRNANPRLCALVPQIKADSQCLHLFQLPFMEDLRLYSFGSLKENPKLQASDDQLQVIDNLIDDMDLMKAERDEDDSPVEAVKSKNISNVMIQRTYQCIQHRSLNEEEPLPEVEPFLARLLAPPQIIQTNCTNSVEKIKKLFPLVPVEKKKSANPSEVWNKKSDIDLNSDEPPSKKAKVDDENEDETDFSIVSLARGVIEEVGTVDPVGDYEKIISRKDLDRFEEASKQLQQVSLRLVKESFGDAMYSKALTCVKKLRVETIRHSEPGLFNNFLKTIKDDLVGTRYAPFWDTIREAEISLITNEECLDSNVSNEESKKFIIEGNEDVAIEEEKEPDEAEADDLLAMMD